MSTEEAPGSVDADSGSGFADTATKVIDDRAPLWKYVEKQEKKGGYYKWKCNFCHTVFNSSYTKVRIHLLKENSTEIRNCTKVTDDAYNEMSRSVQECKDRLDSRKVHIKPSSRCTRRTSSSRSSEVVDYLLQKQKLTEKIEGVLRRADADMQWWKLGCEEHNVLMNEMKKLENEKKDLEEVIRQQNILIQQLDKDISDYQQGKGKKEAGREDGEGVGK